MNQVMAIRPYWDNNTKCWVFDDENYGLKAEAFVLGMSEMIDEFIADLGMPAKESFTMLFSSSPLPVSKDSHLLKLNRLNEECGGCWYERDTVGPNTQVLKGWLCAALFNYFAAAPENIYVAVKDAK